MMIQRWEFSRELTLTNANQNIAKITKIAETEKQIPAMNGFGLSVSQ